MSARGAWFMLAALLAPAMRLAAAADAAQDIRDIRGPKLVLPWWLVPAAALLLALLALAGLWIYRRLRRGRAARALLPFEVALERLEHIRPLMQPENARAFSIAVSDIVRSYIEPRFSITATHRTTEEFLRELLESPKPELLRHRALLSEFLQQCDLVKFAGLSLTLADMESLHGSARAFVLQTAQSEPPAADAGARPQAAADAPDADAPRADALGADAPDAAPAQRSEARA
jgi:hypothetical protein